jgi:predicted RNase H-like HicB family nuclease
VKFYDFGIVMEKEPEDEGYFAYSPSLPGCFSNGMTIEETRRNIRVAIQQHIAALLAHNQISSSLAPLTAVRPGC